MSRTVFVLGAGGFIGRHICEALATDGSIVYAATRRATAFRHPSIENVVAPFDAMEHFTPALALCDAAIHAASTSTPGSTDAQPQLDGNLRSTLAMIEALQDARDCALVYLSSGGTLYGDHAGMAREDDPLRPRSYHGAGKAAAEHFIHAWAAQYAGKATILRPSNVYGPGQAPRPGFGIVATAFECAATGMPLTIWGDGGAVRDYLYVEDLVGLCLAILARDVPAGATVYNASVGEGISLGRLLDLVDATTGTPLTRVHRPPRRVDVHGVVPDGTAARAAFGWRPATTIESGLEATWHWFTNRR